MSKTLTMPMKVCADQLGPFFTRFFQLLLNTHSMPRSWKQSTIMPIAKKPGAREFNDFRPVALTSIIAKCMERLVCNQLIKSVANHMDPLQFAYRAKRGVEDATLTLLNLIASHLDTSGTTVRVLFMDFSSAFNTIQPHVLIKKLLNLEVNPDLILWIRQFLCDRPQRVRLNGSLSRDPVLSDEVIVNTGAPQGCVLSPILFSIYTNDISCNNSFLTLIKYADDMALVGRLKDELSLFEYRLQIDALASQFTSTFLKPNTTKTKELVFGGGRISQTPEPILINNQEVEIVKSFKYLGTVLDERLSFCEHVDYVYKRAQQRLFLLRKLKSFDVSQHILQLVYRSLIESVLSFNIITWYGNVSGNNKVKLARVVNTASKLIGNNQKQLSSIYKDALKRKSTQILYEPAHPLNQAFQKLPSGRRLKVPLAKKNILKKSLVPSAILILNAK